MQFTMNSVEMVHFQICLYMSVWDSLLGRLMEMANGNEHAYSHKKSAK